MRNIIKKVRIEGDDVTELDHISVLDPNHPHYDILRDPELVTHPHYKERILNLANFDADKVYIALIKYRVINNVTRHKRLIEDNLVVDDVSLIDLTTERRFSQ